MIDLEAEMYNHLVLAVMGYDSVFGDTDEQRLFNNALQRFGMSMVQERAVVVANSRCCDHLHQGIPHQRCCVCTAFHHHGISVQVVRDGPEWVIERGCELLRPFGLCVRRSYMDTIHTGQFIVDNGAGHAFALFVGDCTAISFETGVDHLLTTSALDELLDDASTGARTVL